MWHKLITFLAGCTARERWLLALLVFAVLPIAAIWLVAMPLAQDRQSARTAVTEAQALERWVAGQARNYVSAGAAAKPAQTAAPIGISGIEQSLITAGLRRDVSALANNANGGITLQFEAVAFAPLMDWLTAQDDSWGYDLAAFDIAKGERAELVAADFRLVPAQ